MTKAKSTNCDKGGSHTFHTIRYCAICLENAYDEGYEQGKKEAFLLRQKALGKPHLVFITYKHQSQIDIENHFDKPPSYLGWLQKEKKGYVFVPAYQKDYPTDYRAWTIGCLKELINKLEGLSK